MIDKKLDPVGHLKDFSEKDFYWLYLWLCQILNIDAMQLTHREYKEFCMNAIHNKVISINEILNKKNREVVSNHVIEWINKKDKRLLLWLNFKIGNTSTLLNITNYNQDLYLNFTSKMDFYYQESILGLINNQAPLSLNKQRLIKELEQQWKAWINSTYDFEKWLSEANKNQLTWCLEYLKGNTLFENLTIKMNYSNDRKSMIIYILHIFDITKFKNNEEYSNTINRLKKSWAQYKFNRGNKTKDEYKIMITKKTNNLLLELCKQSNLSKEKMIEQMILAHHKELNITQSIDNSELTESNNIINFKDLTLRDTSLENE